MPDKTCEELIREGHFNQVKPPRNGRYMVECPMPEHKDDKASLQIRDGLTTDGKHILLVKCFGGCDSTAILNYFRGNAFENIRKLPDAVLKAIAEGKPYQEKPQVPKKIFKIYDYRDPDGVLMYQVVKYIPKDFSYRRPATEEEKEETGYDWIWSVKGVKRYLYRVDELVKHPKEKYIGIVEGEKDADNLVFRGIQATTNPFGSSGGSGEFKWLAEFNEYFEGRNVFLIPDNDDSSYKHVRRVAENILPVANSVVLLKLDLKILKEDVSDWFEKYGGTKDKFTELFRTEGIELKGLSEEELEQHFIFHQSRLEEKLDYSSLDDLIDNSDIEAFDSAFLEYVKKGEKTLEESGWTVGLCETCGGSEFQSGYGDDGQYGIYATRDAEGNPVLMRCQHIYKISEERKEEIEESYPY